MRYTVEGEPLKTGLCHCTDCRKETGSAFLVASMTMLRLLPLALFGVVFGSVAARIRQSLASGPERWDRVARAIAESVIATGGWQAPAVGPWLEEFAGGGDLPEGV